MNNEHQRFCLEAFCPYLKNQLTVEHIDDLAFAFQLHNIFNEGKFTYLFIKWLIN